MHKHPRRDRGSASVMALLVPILLLLMIAIVPVHIGSRAAIAAVGPLIVYGHVNYTSAGGPVDGANVVVTIYDGVNARATLTDVTDSAGFYMVTFGNGDWDVGNTIYVAAIKGIDSGFNSIVATTQAAFEPQTIDVNFGTSIPELGGPAMTVLTVSALGMMVVFYARRRGSESP